MQVAEERKALVKKKLVQSVLFLPIVSQVQTLVYGLHLPEEMADEQ
jgi:hypothetical protein